VVEAIFAISAILLSCSDPGPITHPSQKDLELAEEARKITRNPDTPRLKGFRGF